MTLSTPLRLLALALVAAVLTLPTASATARASSGSESASSADERRVVFFDLYYQEEVKPKKIFFYANSGPYVRNLSWKGWGTQKAVGRGFYISTCASCDPPRKRAAVLRFRGLKYCATRDVWFYKRATMTRKPSEGQTRTVKISAGSCPPRSEA